MKFINKLKKKCYIQCGLAVILTGIFLVVLCSLWTKRQFVVSFDATSVKNIEYQVFYTKTQEFNQKQSIKKRIPKGTHHVKIILPIKKIKRLRFDFGVEPTKVIISNFKIRGLHQRKLDFNDFVYNEDIDKHNLKDGILTIESGKKDPFIVYKKYLNLKGKIIVDWYMFIILSTFGFLLFCKLVRYLAKFKLEQSYSRIDIVLLSVFFVLLWLPMLHISNAETSMQENRTLAKKPVLFLQEEINTNFGEQFNQWFSDRFWGRKKFLAFYDKIKFVLEPHNGNNRVLIGKDNWFFYKGDNSLRNFANSVTLEEEDLQKGLSYLKALDDWCKENGKEFYYIIAPDKNKIYGEYYRLVKKEKTDDYGIGNQFVNYIKENSDIKVLYLYDVLINNKDKGLLYFKHDTHWSDLGAYYGYKELMKLMNRPANSYNFEERERVGDLDRMITGRKNDEATYKFLKTKGPSVCKVTDKEDNSTVKCHNPQKTENLFMLRDSFASSLLKYLSNHFGNIQTYHHKKHPLTEEDLKFIKNNVDVVILENVERYTPSVLRCKFPED